MDGIKPGRTQNNKKRLVLSQQTPASPPVATAPQSGLALPRQKSHGWRWFWVITGVFLTLIIAAAIAGYWWYQDALQPRSADTATVTVVVEEGASLDEVAKELEDKSVIKSSLAFIVYVRLAKTTIKAGTYLLAPNQTVAEIVDWLNEGKISTRKVTILPGKTVKQIRQTLVESGFSEAEVDAALAKAYDHPLLADKPPGATLEGYLFPETYLIEHGSTVEALLLRAFDEFYEQLEAHNLKQKLAARGFSLHQGVILASIVTREVGAKDQAQVAQVFETRLARGMRLGADATYHYAADQMGVAPSVNLDSPYNTRLHAGLPPGPIANFTLSALQAVAEPAAGDYLYFVSGDDGVTYFAHTFEQHQQNIQQHCKELCSRP